MSRVNEPHPTTPWGQRDADQPSCVALEPPAGGAHFLRAGLVGRELDDRARHRLPVARR